LGVLAFDNGTTYSIGLDASFTPQTTANGICNNGHEIFGAFVNGFGVFDGPDTSDKFFGGTFDGGFINANGDAVFIDGHDDELIFAQDLTTASTPEPSSLFLLGTGCLSLLGTLRRYTRSA
jgi:PEP-CTERM motif